MPAHLVQRALVLSALLSAAPARLPAAPPIDVPSDHWASAAVQRVLAAGLMGNHPGGAFLGKDLVTRFDLALAAFRLEELGRERHCKDAPPGRPASTRLPDLPIEHPLATAAGVAVRYDYLQTDKEGHLRGTGMVSRFAVARVVATYLDRFLPDLLPEEKLVFPDVPANHLDAAHAARAVAARVLMVHSEGDFKGSRLVNRYDLAISLSKLLDRERSSAEGVVRPGCGP
jgi:hypothetical protein